MDTTPGINLSMDTSAFNEQLDAARQVLYGRTVEAVFGYDDSGIREATEQSRIKAFEPLLSRKPEPIPQEPTSLRGKSGRRWRRGNR